MKNQLSQKDSMKIPVHCTGGGKLITQIIAHIILLLKSYSCLKSLRTVILADFDFLYLSEKHRLEISRLLF